MAVTLNISTSCNIISPFFRNWPLIFCGPLHITFHIKSLIYIYYVPSSHFAYSHMLWFAKYYLYVYVSCEESSATKYISCNKKVDHIQCNRLVTQTLIWMYYCCYIFVIWHVCITYNSTKRTLLLPNFFSYVSVLLSIHSIGRGWLVLDNVI